MFIGYARVSTHDQTLALQQDALTQAGCQRIFTDTASGGQTDRPGLSEALSHLRPGDILVVWKLDRLGRSLKDLIARITQLQNQDIGFKSLITHAKAAVGVELLLREEKAIRTIQVAGCARGLLNT